jgi:hypothetical protein
VRVVTALLVLLILAVLVDRLARKIWIERVELQVSELQRVDAPMHFTIRPDAIRIQRAASVVLAWEPPI